MNTILKIQSRGTITLPKKMRQILNLKEGDFLSANLKDNKVVIEPTKVIDEDLQKDVLKSLQDIKNGNFISFSSSKEMRSKIK